MSDAEKEMYTTAGTVPARYSRQGYHFCPNELFDLIGPSDPEWQGCRCSIKLEFESVTKTGEV